MRTNAIRISVAVVAALLGTACDRSVTIVEQIPESAGTACFRCHRDEGALLAAVEAQWVNSAHAGRIASDGNTAACNPCHTAEGFVAVTEGGAAPGVVAYPSPIHCFACHAPHERGDFSLRSADTAILENGHTVDLGRGNVCAACHRSRHDVTAYVGTGDDTVVSFDADWGPHKGSQTDIFAGSNGYEYPLVPYFDGPHLGRMPDGCMHCHFDSTDGSTIGGHSFNMRWGGPGDERLNVKACNTAACHDGIDDFDHNDVQSDVRELLSLLRDELIAAGLIDTNGHPVEGRVVAAADSAGAVWNYLIVSGDGSAGVHNPDYVLDLLGSSLLFMGGTLPQPARP